MLAVKEEHIVPDSDISKDKQVNVNKVYKRLLELYGE